MKIAVVWGMSAILALGVQGDADIEKVTVERSQGNITGADISGGPGDAHNPDQFYENVARAVAAEKAAGRLSPSEIDVISVEHGLDANDIQDLSLQDLDTVPTAAPSARTLPLTHRPQINSYYCGPAAAMMLIHSGSSNYNGASLSQANLGSSAHLNTTPSAGTPWASGRMALGINRWLGHDGANSPYVYGQTGQPSVATIQLAARQSIGVKFARIAGGTVEFAGGAHYNGHPQHLTIGHWITGYGYTNNGSTIRWADPATSLWSATNPTFTANTTNFRQFLATNGILWFP